MGGTWQELHSPCGVQWGAGSSPGGPLKQAWVGMGPGRCSRLWEEKGCCTRRVWSIVVMAVAPRLSHGLHAQPVAPGAALWRGTHGAWLCAVPGDQRMAAGYHWLLM